MDSNLLPIDRPGDSRRRPYPPPDAGCADGGGSRLLSPFSAPAFAATYTAGAASVPIRAARLSDVPDIVALINGFAAQHVMLPKSADSVVLALDDFVVATDPHGRVIGCAAVREYSPSLAEVASVAVEPKAHGRGIGAALIRRVEQLARARGIADLFALTTTPPFFQSAGYHVVDRALFPEKIRRDCVGCSRRSACAEVCVYRSLDAAQQQAA